jgi:hypothetical protein
MMIVRKSSETAPGPAEAAGGPTHELIAGVLVVALYAALWACVSATVLRPLASVLG